MDRPTCATCHHFDARPLAAKPGVGTCRHGPPGVDPASGQGRFPLMDADDGCGQHTHAKAYRLHLEIVRPEEVQ